MYSLGLVSISFRKNTVDEIIAAVKKAGLSCIEWGSDVHAPCNDIETLERIAFLQKENEIFCSSYGTYFRLGVNDTKELYEYIKAAKILGTDILRLWCGNKGSKEYSQSELEGLYEECKKAAFIAEKEGVVLCMECHNNTLTDEKETARKLIDTVNSSSLKMYWQPNQYKNEKENLSYAELLAPDTKHIHIFNWKGDSRFSLNDAIAEWRKYLGKFRGNRTLLLEFMPDDNIETLDSQANALKEIVKDD